MEKITIELSDGHEVICEEYFACDNDVFEGSESGEWVDVLDGETGDLIVTFMGRIPQEEEMLPLFKDKVEEVIYS